MTTIQLEDDELIPDAEYAKGWGVTQRTLWRYEKQKDGLPFVMVGGRKYRPRKKCAAWLERRIQAPNPKRGAA